MPATRSDCCNFIACTSVLLLCVLTPPTHGLSPVSATINWDEVPDSPPSARNLNSASLGECICDVTLNVCDVNCCCDADCLADEIALFTGSCLPEKVSGPEIDDCIHLNSATELVRISDWGGTVDRVKVAADAVCLERNNYPNGAESYFQVPSTVSKPADSLLQPDWFVADTTTSGFEVGKRMPLVRFSNTSGIPRVISVGGGSLSVPFGGPGGMCHASYEKPVAFFTPLTTSSCKVAGESSATVCDYISLSRFTQQDALANPSGTITGATTLVVITTRVHSAASGALLYTIDNLPLRQSFFTLSNATALTPNTTSSPYTTSWDPSLNLCMNGVSFVRTTITYDVSASVRVRNVTRDVFIDNIDVSPSSGGHTFEHEVYMLRSGSSSDSAAAAARYHEGSPGFLEGKFIPAGVLLTDGSGKEAIQQRIGGFAIPSGGKSCWRNQYKTVPFMHNVISSGCTLSITEQELQTLCANTAVGTSQLLNAILTINGTTLGDGTVLNTTTSPITRVAKTADALIIDPTSWVTVDGYPITSPTPNPYDSVGRRCSNLVVGLSYSFVVARAGKESNPQDVIVGAYVEPIVGAWRIRNDTDYSTAASSSVAFTFRVHFERYLPGSQTTVSRRIVAPPILPEIDDTIFYPFRMP